MSDTLTNNELKLIGSLQNKKFRDINNLYVIEGEHLIDEYLKSDLPDENVKYIIARNDYQNYDLEERVAGFNIHTLNRAKFDKLCDTKSPQGILAVIEKKMIYANEQNRFIVALENINDPGNLGTILRTCYWFGVDKVLISENSADIFNPKTIRSTQGSLFHLSIETDVNLKTKLESLSKNGFDVFVTSLDGKPLGAEVKTDKCVLVFGNEANGVSYDIQENKDFKQIKIESYTECESLNVAVSAGILISE
ncbi:MAG: TrmH family RNA methyltransferase, partial [Ignavibacteria bacterium]